MSHVAKSDYSMLVFFTFKSLSFVLNKDLGELMGQQYH